MKKILVAFLFVLIGFYTPTFLEIFDEDIFQIFMLFPYIGLPLAIWGMFEKK